MNDLASKYGGEVDFTVIYTHKAHPGQQYHRYTSFEQKCGHAQDAERYESIERDVLVDEVEGMVHCAHDTLFNSVSVIGA